MTKVNLVAIQPKLLFCHAADEGHSCGSECLDGDLVCQECGYDNTNYYSPMSEAEEAEYKERF